MKSLKSHKTFNGTTQFWEHDSVETGSKMKFSTFVPEGKTHGAILFLAGLTCTEENFIVKAGAQKFLSEAGLMVICPDTSPRGFQLPQEHDSWDFGSGASFYVDATIEGYRDHYKMDSYITNEIHSILQKQFGIPSNKISISGHSMGGHGALVLGLRNPEKFQSISAFSPITHPTVCPWGEKAFTGYLGGNLEDWKKYDATELIKNGKRHANTIYVDQGSSDEFLEKQLLPAHLENACKEANQPLQLNYREGYDHSYYFISTFIADHINFHKKTLLVS
jgi:S-formylglutathione hydrolase